ncbi:MAG: PEGA domain-containing protein [Magnetococcales bacterium]|nr:PEGA domain-containing protein [Magnetococcales bacterium]
MLTGASSLKAERIDKRHQLYAESHALIIGNGAYRGAWSEIPEAKKIVDHLAWVFHDRGFQVETLMNPDRLQLEQGIKGFLFRKAAQPDSRVVVYYLGHAYTSSGKNPSAYLVPITATLASDHKNARDHMVPMATYLSWFDGPTARHQLLLFDAALDETLFTSSSSRRRSSEQQMVTLPPEHAAAITSPTLFHPVRRIMSRGFATHKKHGQDIHAFSHALMESLDMGDEDGDGLISGRELTNYMQMAVLNPGSGKGLCCPQRLMVPTGTTTPGEIVFRAGGYREPSRTLFEEGKEEPPPFSGITATLEIESEPDGASIFVNNRPMGMTPARLENLPVGQAAVRLELAGHESYRSVVPLAPGTHNDLFAPMKRHQHGKIILESTPSAANWFLNGEWLGTTPDIYTNVALGNYTITIQGARHRSWRKTVRVSGKKPVHVKARLKKVNSSLTLHVEPEMSTIHVDGDHGPYWNGMPLPVGNHLITVSHPGYITHRFTHQQKREHMERTVILKLK